MALRGQRHMLAKIDPGNLSLGNIAQEEFWAQVNFRGEWMPSVFTLKQEFTWSWWTFKSALLDETKQRLRRRLRPTPPFRHFTLPCKFFVPRAIFVLGWNISWKVCEALMEIHTTQLKFFSFLQWINEMETLKKPLWFCCVKSSSYVFFFYSSIDDDLNVKVTDCALSRDLFPQDYCCLGDNENRPVKWMAVESLEKLRFTVASDVVSFSYNLLATVVSITV